MATRHIDAEHLKLALVARKVRPVTRWAAMSDGAQTSFCWPHPAGGGYLIHTPPLMGPMSAGRMHAVFDRVRSQGRPELLRTWRTSIAVLKAEFAICVLREVRA